MAYHTILRQDAVPDPYMLRAFGNDGTVYYYGVFATRKDAIEFGKGLGYHYEATRLILIDSKD